MSFRDLKLRGVYSPGDRPLEDFYVPLLRQAVAYDRVTGYFRSSALVVAAAGISRFVASGGKMRLIAGAELTDEDVSAVIEGEDLAEVVAKRLAEAPLEATDIVAEHRLGTLAYLVREGRLELKVGVPVDRFGRPLTRQEAAKYFHTKYGILRDGDGNRVAFVGSDNETASGWRRNHETFTVAKSWLSEVWEEQGKELAEKFEALWDGQPDPQWVILDLPEAVEKELIERAPAEPPDARDSAETHTKLDDAADLARLQFVAVAPRIAGGTGVGYATSGVEPFPHQSAIARRALETFPRSFLLADEVGLGKTIEAGLILRELLVTGRVDRVLALVPASVIRQWQQELAEKFALDLPRFDGGAFYDADENELDWTGGNPWEAFPVLLASSHLARRRDRRSQILAAAPWDVVLVDEAHHARRRGGKSTAEPNTLLRLLQEMKAARAWKALYLASATPMQMHAHEAWDLLELLGLEGRWAASADLFVRYYTELRSPYDERAWELLSEMEVDYFRDPVAHTDAALARAAKEQLGPAGARPILRLGTDGITASAAKSLSGAERDYMDRWLRAHTPMRDRVFRTTRTTLRDYKARGLLKPGTNIPHRRVDDRFIPLTPEEEALYNRIEIYISRFYNAYLAAGGQAQRALGFIMTVYRRRLTSSFLAIERSLSRRLEALVRGATLVELLDDDDVAALETSPLADDGLEGPARELAEEVAELRSFLSELAKRPPDESKMAYLHQELREAFAGRHDTVIVFTQYTDTMDYIRDQLLPVYGPKIACYSGRGGERYAPETGDWESISKEDVKNLFRDGIEVKILIGTDSLSEGLNLQTCGKLINYDMPWNFMRVEQRIGRVDRIGGQEQVEIANYFYEGTVEEQIYRGIGEDFEWFEDVVGPAQPVLNQVESAIESAAMHGPTAERRRDIEQRVREIREQIEEAKASPVTIDEVGIATEPAPEPEPAIDLPTLERILTTATRTAERFEPHPEIDGAYLLAISDTERSVVTFRRSVLDEHAPAVKLLTYATSDLAAVLDDVPTAQLDEGALRLGPSLVRNLEDLEAELST